MKLKELDLKYEKLLDSEVTVSGWVLTMRAQKEIQFIKLNDGSNAKGLQLIVTSNSTEESNDIKNYNITMGSSLIVTGKLVRSPAVEQPYELSVSKIVVMGHTREDYPLAKGKLPMDYLRKYAHLRMRTSSFGSIFRIKSAISMATHQFFNNNGFLHINPNIITVNECEGGAGVFQVTEHDISDHSKLPKSTDPSGNLLTTHDWSKDHFDRPAYLTVSSQLQLEAIACSLGSVYTTNKSFRSEHSTTNKHLSEFEHLEIEDVFTDLDRLMDIGENYIKWVGNYILTNAMEDVDNLGKFVSKGLKERILTIVSANFTRVRYADAINILKNAKGLSKPAEYGDDLNSEYEHYLTEHFKGPVFVHHWPLAIKSFYMKSSEPSSQHIECENFDLLMPYRVGELIGGSMREDNLETMRRVMKEKGVSEEPLSFYLDLRRHGTVPHGGFGLGLDRMCMMYTGMENIKDVVAFPVHFKNCNY
jgi:asparaginyl-tRNA synthetase